MVIPMVFGGEVPQNIGTIGVFRWPGLSFLVGLGAATNVRSPEVTLWVVSVFPDDRKEADDGIEYSMILKYHPSTNRYHYIDINGVTPRTESRPRSCIASVDSGCTLNSSIPWQSPRLGIFRCQLNQSELLEMHRHEEWIIKGNNKVFHDESGALLSVILLCMQMEFQYVCVWQFESAGSFLACLVISVEAAFVFQRFWYLTR